MRDPDWKLRVDAGRPYPRLARVQRFAALSTGFLGACLGVLVVPLGIGALLAVRPLLDHNAAAEQVSAAPSTASPSFVELLEAGISVRNVLILSIVGAAVGFVSGALFALLFNRLAPTTGGLEIDVELLPEGTGHDALRRVGEEPVFDGR